MASGGATLPNAGCRYNFEGTCLVCGAWQVLALDLCLATSPTCPAGLDGPQLMSGMESEELSSYLTSGGCCACRTSMRETCTSLK